MCGIGIGDSFRRIALILALIFKLMLERNNQIDGLVRLIHDVDILLMELVRLIK